MKAATDKDTIIARFLEGPAIIEEVLSGLKESDLDTSPKEGGWTIRQMVHHLADGDDLWKMAIKMALGNENAEFSLNWYQEYPQETWSVRWAYAQRPIEESLAMLKASRLHVIQLINHVPDAWDRFVIFRNRDDELEKVTVGFIIEMQAEHVVHHLKQIEALVSKE